MINKMDLYSLIRAYYFSPIGIKNREERLEKERLEKIAALKYLFVGDLVKVNPMCRFSKSDRYIDRTGIVVKVIKKQRPDGFPRYSILWSGNTRANPEDYDRIVKIGTIRFKKVGVLDLKEKIIKTTGEHSEYSKVFKKITRELYESKRQIKKMSKELGTIKLKEELSKQ